MKEAEVNVKKFIILSCVSVDEDGYSGPAVALGCVEDPSLVLLFPIMAENAYLIQKIIYDQNRAGSMQIDSEHPEDPEEEENEENVFGDRQMGDPEELELPPSVFERALIVHRKNYNLNLHNLYKMMVDSWRNSNRFLSGILMDKEGKNVMTAKIILSHTDTGSIDSFVDVIFGQAMILSVMGGIEIIMSDEVLELMLPSQTFGDQEDDGNPDAEGPVGEGKDPFVDENLLKIAKEIMNGEVKESQEPKESKQ